MVAAGLLAVVLAAAGCGSDDEPAATTPTATTETETEPTATMSTPEETPTETAPAETVPGTGTGTSPEDTPGGAGDEEPARTLALFTARAGQIRPRLVRVPAFISVQIELRSADGAAYALRFGDTTIRAGGQINSTSTTIDGLRPGESIVGVPQGAGNKVRISATAEPGP
ncbi:MAG: hypothetical protein ABW142_01355 [Thermoleophilaceae bacterium]